MGNSNALTDLTVNGDVAMNSPKRMCKKALNRKKETTKTGSFFVLRKLLLVSCSFVIWVLFGFYFSIFCIRHLVASLVRNTKRLLLNHKKLLSNNSQPFKFVAGIRTERILRKKADCKKLVMRCFTSFG